ncbi:MAG: hypothetical protein NUV75_08895 [Gallionella sp.]|nr:hypothetical protein [Gallionella sp.]
MATDEIIEMSFDDAQDDEISIPQKENNIFTSSGDPEIDSLLQQTKKGASCITAGFSTAICLGFNKSKQAYRVGNFANTTTYYLPLRREGW